MDIFGFTGIYSHKQFYLTNIYLIFWFNGFPNGNLFILFRNWKIQKFSLFIIKIVSWCKCLSLLWVFFNFIHAPFYFFLRLKTIDSSHDLHMQIWFARTLFLLRIWGLVMLFLLNFQEFCVFTSTSAKLFPLKIFYSENWALEEKNGSYQDYFGLEYYYLIH